MIAQTMNESWKAQGGDHWLVAGWQEGLRRALESMVGPETVAAARLQAVVAEPDTWSGWPAPLWCRLALGPAPGTLTAGAPRATVAVLGRLVAGAELGDAEAEETFLEVLNQAAAGAADTISERLGRRVQFSPAQTTEPPEARDFAVQVELLWEGVIYALALVPSPDLMTTVGEEALPATMSVLPPLAPAAAGAPVQTPANLDLLLEVELPVCVTFGRTQLPLKDVLKLSSGSIVELNRLANEPVEVLINNCVIARGEVVVVDGNYGIRVTEIVSRQERIRSIF